MKYQYEIIKINNEDFFDELFRGWDGFSEIKITEQSDKELNIFWLETLKKNHYSSDEKKRKSATRTFKWLKENYPELLI
jgi:hypothetical protein